MNKQTRKKISDEIEVINGVVERISDISSAEEEKLNSIPENLSSGDLYTKIEDAIDYIDSAIDCLQEAVENLSSCNET